MAKKQSTNRRTQVKDLSKKNKALTAKDMKKVKGGHEMGHTAFGIQSTDQPTKGVADVNGDGRLDFTTKKPS